VHLVQHLRLLLVVHWQAHLPRLLLLPVVVVVVVVH
jgi:hypothetical protein